MRAFIMLFIMTLLFSPSSFAEDAPAAVLSQQESQETIEQEQIESPKEEEEEEEDTSTTYAPETCEFTVTFPNQPYTTKICNTPPPTDSIDAETTRITPPDPKNCADQVSFTQVYDMSSAMNVRVICNSIDTDMKDSYSTTTMAATLRLMAQESGVQTFETSVDETALYKQASLAGEGKKGMTPSIFIAQLWIGDNSALSVEAELTGEPNPAADSLFRDILQSIHHKSNVTSQPQKNE